MILYTMDVFISDCTLDRIVGKRENEYKVEWRLPNRNHQAWEARVNIGMQYNGQRLIDE
jgi:hypothetical protein